MSAQPVGYTVGSPNYEWRICRMFGGKLLRSRYAQWDHIVTKIGGREWRLEFGWSFHPQPPCNGVQVKKLLPSVYVYRKVWFIEKKLGCVPLDVDLKEFKRWLATLLEGDLIPEGEKNDLYLALFEGADQ